MQRESKRQKVNLGGVSQKEPYKVDSFKAFIEWSILTNEERKAVGLPTAKVFAEKYSLLSQP